MNIPNLLTTIRFILIPVFFIIYFSSMDNSFITSMLVFFSAGITDVLDGYIARKYNLITKLGTVLDPLADKLMTLSVLFCLSLDKIISKWVFIIFLIKEMFMILGGIKLFKYKKVISAKYYGKLATAFLYLSIAVMILDRSIGIYIMYISICVTLFAFINYLMTYIFISKNKDMQL
ncbi:CDP-diacylglycerol--glycerol-3-phosphate 3-phosphatidyltransferase [Fervidicella metallireducens AeB]|uniref:CDP-diacylglycerol--glycerol-3-phosphate 3-phosphatidyltransferase n=1 Tax=Fervidicella metallireducens AeB TaxID=1403537 RepID=A0A017RRS5_9CLOT|nr:CDP-alcohol phosphatidyltransferase family protein [Fervidicella metallireducens]EYE87458.1 CDP-diacylglycerol--glycerol-3-phosphate 3-phosphatidyltransferase [Fervidicella metallireducens AeB]